MSRQLDTPARALAELAHRLRERPGLLDRLHERAVADLDVEDDRVGARGDLLRHDARRDQLDVVDGRGDVAQRVQPLVGRNEIAGLADDREPDVLDLRDELVFGELDAEARDRLELVERAAGVAEPAPAHLPERDAARGDDRPDRDRRLVPHAAGRVLVDDRSPERGVQVERVAAPHHRVGERERLRRREPAEEHRHAEGGHLVVGHLVARVAEHELRDLVGVELAAVALALDQLGGTDHPS